MTRTPARTWPRPRSAPGPAIAACCPMPTSRTMPCSYRHAVRDCCCAWPGRETLAAAAGGRREPDGHNRPGDGFAGVVFDHLAADRTAAAGRACRLCSRTRPSARPLLRERRRLRFCGDGRARAARPWPPWPTRATRCSCCGADGDLESQLCAAPTSSGKDRHDNDYSVGRWCAAASANGSCCPRIRRHPAAPAAAGGSESEVTGIYLPRRGRSGWIR